jgi:hypothetical protein
MSLSSGKKNYISAKGHEVRVQKTEAFDINKLGEVYRSLIK